VATESPTVRPSSRRSATGARVRWIPANAGVITVRPSDRGAQRLLCAEDALDDAPLREQPVAHAANEDSAAETRPKITTKTPRREVPQRQIHTCVLTLVRPLCLRAFVVQLCGFEQLVGPCMKRQIQLRNNHKDTKPRSSRR